MRSGAQRGCPLGLNDLAQIQLVFVQVILLVQVMLDSQQVNLENQVIVQVNFPPLDLIGSTRWWRLCHARQFGCLFDLVVDFAQLPANEGLLQLLPLDFGWTHLQLVIQFQQLLFNLSLVLAIVTGLPIFCWMSLEGSSCI